MRKPKPLLTLQSYIPLLSYSIENHNYCQPLQQSIISCLIYRNLKINAQNPHKTVYN